MASRKQKEPSNWDFCGTFSKALDFGNLFMPKSEKEFTSKVQTLTHAGLKGTLENPLTTDRASVEYLKRN